MLIRLSAFIVVLCLSDSSVHTQRVIHDSILDLCYWTRPERAATRCEGSEDIKFERRLYQKSVSYYCLAINNKKGAYRSLLIEYDGEKEFRNQDNYFANEVLSDSVYEDSFNLQHELIEMVIFPLNAKQSLQRIIQIKIDNNIQCDLTRALDDDRVFSNQPNTNNARFINSCLDIESRAKREQNQYEMLDEVIVEELKFNEEIRYYCIVVDKTLRKNSFPYFDENEQIEVRLSTNNTRIAFSPKGNNKNQESTRNYFKFSFKKRYMRIAIYPKNLNDDIGKITSIKVNGIESFFAKPDKQCGHVPLDFAFFISFGLKTEPGEFPWHVGLFEVNRTDSSIRYFCGGSIIARNTILTAAHCLDRDHGLINEDEIRVQAGRHDLLKPDPNMLELRVERYILYKSWIKSERANDIAIIKLKEMLEYSNYIQPVCFSRDKLMFADKEGSVVGWGIDENNRMQNILKRAPMRITPNDDCRNTNRTILNSLVNESTFCAGYRNGTSACPGDSGGGLVFNFNNKWYIRGIVSVSTAIVDKVNLQTRCDNVQYVIFTDVSETRYYNWIEEQLAH